MNGKFFNNLFLIVAALSACTQAQGMYKFNNLISKTQQAYPLFTYYTGAYSLPKLVHAKSYATYAYPFNYLPVGAGTAATHTFLGAPLTIFTDQQAENSLYTLPSQVSVPTLFTQSTSADSAQTAEILAGEPSSSYSLFTGTHLALIAALAATGYGLYRYHKAYITPTEALIDESIAFMEKLIENPYFLLRDNLTNFSEKLNDEKFKLLRSLGLIDSYINPKTYTYNLIKEERKSIDDLFENLKKQYNLTIIDKIPITWEKFSQECQTSAINIYISLLQAKNMYKPETLNRVISKISQNLHYDVTKELFTEEYENTLYRTYFFLRKTIENPKNYIITLNQSTIADINQRQESIKELKLEHFKALGLTHNFLQNIFGYKLTPEKEYAKQELEKLYKALADSITFNIQVKKMSTGTLDTYMNTYVVVPAQHVCEFILSQLDNEHKWNIVRDYVITLKKTFYLMAPEITIKSQSAGKSTNPFDDNYESNGNSKLTHIHVLNPFDSDSE